MTSKNVSGRPIYLDNHATTPVDPRVAGVVLHHMTVAFGNASSAGHSYGEEADAAVVQARAYVAKLVGAEPERVVFTSGATEALNLGLQGYIQHRARSGVSGPARVALPPTEHRAVLDICQALAEASLATLVWLPVDGAGRLHLEAFEAACVSGLDLACIMAANNEVGTIQPLDEVSAIARPHGVPVLTDATQAAGKIPLHFVDWGLSMLALTAHKMYGPQGAGALIVGHGISLDPVLYGGGQQGGIRPGTLNLPGIAGFGEACRLRVKEMDMDEPAIARRRDRLQSLLLERIPGIVVNGAQERRLAGNLHVSVPGALNTVVQALLHGTLALSTGSACSSGAIGSSHVLRALRMPDSLAEGALRFGLGRFTTDDEVERAAELVTTAIRHAVHGSA